LIDLHCACGRVYHADESQVGRSLRCTNPTCGAVLLVERKAISTQPVPQPIESVPARPLSVDVKNWEKQDTVLLVVGVSLLTTLLTLGWFAGKSPLETTPTPRSSPPPCIQGQSMERPPTGARIGSSVGNHGRYKLVVRNGTSHDAVVRLYDIITRRSAQMVYVRAGESYTIRKIEFGVYGLRFAGGTGWVPKCREFAKEPRYAQFRDTLAFDLIDVEGYEVTLNPVPEGTAKVDEIDRSTFFEGDQDISPSP